MGFGKEKIKQIGGLLVFAAVLVLIVMHSSLVYRGIVFCFERKDCIYGCHLGTLSHYRKISIIMPVWNSAKYLREAIDSVLSQDFCRHL